MPPSILFAISFIVSSILGGILYDVVKSRTLKLLELFKRRNESQQIDIRIEELNATGSIHLLTLGRSAPEEYYSLTLKIPHKDFINNEEYTDFHFELDSIDELFNFLSKGKEYIHNLPSTNGTTFTYTKEGKKLLHGVKFKLDLETMTYYRESEKSKEE